MTLGKKKSARLGEKKTVRLEELKSVFTAFMLDGYGFAALPKSSTASGLSQLLFSSSRTRVSNRLTLALFSAFACS
jgi:hypothetical protein